jgi:hypothetical protein
VNLIDQDPQDHGGLFCGACDVSPSPFGTGPSCPDCDEIMRGWDSAPGPYSPDLAECECGAVLAIWDVQWCYR